MRTVIDDLLAQAASVEELHDQEGPAFGIEVVVENRDDVGMTQLRAGAALAEETLTRIRIRTEVWPHDLDRDLVAEQGATGSIHRPHTPFRDGRDNLVTAVEDGSRC